MSMTVVSPAWLDLREPADAAARSEELAARLARHLPAGGLSWSTTSAAAAARWAAGSPRGWPGRSTGSCTTGTRRCWTSPSPTRRAGARRADDRGPGVRHHPAGAGGPGRSRPRRRLGAARPADRRRAGRDARRLRGCPMLLALTVVGRVALTPADPLDAALAAAFDDHQRADGLLGPDAVPAALDVLARARGRRPAEPVAPRRSPRRADGRVARRVGRGRDRAGACAGRGGRRLPRTGASGSWRPASSRSSSTTPTSWCCRDRRAVGGGRAPPPRPRCSPCWSGASARARSSTASTRSTAGRWRRPPVSPC